MLIISLVSFGGGASALFYDFGVSRMGWITGDDLSAILAFGYATPGPAVFGIATFIGYRIGGIPGAIVGTVSIFVMPWLLAMLAAKHLSGFLKSPHAPSLIRAVGLAAAGIVAYIAVQLMPAGSSSGALYLIVAAIAFFASVRLKLNPIFTISVALLLGIVIK